ncbi:transposase [bacterium]|nr:transposase [bacterium]
MQSALNYSFMVKKLRQFFQEKKGFIEVPAQSRVSILAACEQPQTITNYCLGGVTYPLPQTGQMWLEHELLKNPQWPGVFCVTTSYRDEPNPIEGRHHRIFPMFEFESAGDFFELKKLEKELLGFLGFKEPSSLSYQSICQKYNIDVIEAEHETQLAYEYGSCISLEHFPGYTNPFWNMKSQDGYTYSKIDVLLHGMETIGSAERETDKEKMRDRFHRIEKGEYSALLFNKFGKERVMSELETYLSLPMMKRFGGGIGLTRLERAMKLEGLLPKESL